MRLKTLAIALALTVAVPLGGCTTIQSWLSGGSVANANPTAVSDAEKALTVAHLAYQGAGIALQQAAASGALHGANAATAKVYFDKAGAALDIADQADQAVNAAGIYAAVADVVAAITSLDALIPQK